MVKHILSINFNHDGSGVILSGGKIAAYVNTERFSRHKKHPGIRTAELQQLLTQAGLTLTQIDAVIFNNLGMNYPEVIRRHGTDFKSTWLKFKISGQHVTIEGVKLPLMPTIGHFMMHNSLAYFTSPFDSAMTFSVDPVGFNAHLGQGNKLNFTQHFLPYVFNANHAYVNASCALFDDALYSAGKVMGLAPYGEIKGDIPPVINPQKPYKEIHNGAQSQPVYVREGKQKLNARLAYLTQDYLEHSLTQTLDRLYDVAMSEGIEPNLCLCGGTALNSVANQVAFERSKFEHLHLHPACGDDGTAIGAALYYWHHVFDNPRQTFSNKELMYSPKHYDDDIDKALWLYRDKISVDERDDYINKTAELIADGHIIGWFQGGSEIGPRALGNRSIIADPRNPEMKDRLNNHVKFREGFRPFAPSVLNEHAQEWFGLKDSPFMLRVCTVLKESVPAITHHDHTARIQTVTEHDNPKYYDLIKAFYQHTQVPIVINTSFNVKGEPVVETPIDAIQCFLNSGIDYLVFENKIIKKADRKNLSAFLHRKFSGL